MSDVNARRKFLMSLAAAGVGAGLYLPLSRYGLARTVMQSRQDAAKLKVVFYIVPDGIGTEDFNEPGGEYQGKGIWHPKVAEGVIQTDDFELNEATKGILDEYRPKSLYLRGLLNPMAGSSATEGLKDRVFGGHDAWTGLLRDHQREQASIDNLLGAKLTGSDPTQRVIYAGPHTQLGNTSWNTSYLEGASTGLIPQHNPLALFKNIFGNNLRVPRRRFGVKSAHVFDTSIDEINAVMSAVGGSERQKLTTHLDAVEALVRDLGNVAEGPVCNPSPPEIEATDAFLNASQYRHEVHDAHNKVVATALGCGVSRVATIQVSHSSENLNFPDVAPTKNPHTLAHWGSFGGDAPGTDRQEWVSSRQWYVKKFALFLDELARYDDPNVEGDKLLDHTIVILTSEMSDGAREHCMDMPMLMVGGKYTGLNVGTGGRGYYKNFMLSGDGEVYDQWNTTRPTYQACMQRLWATLARSAGIGEVPYTGNIETLPDVFTNIV